MSATRDRVRTLIEQGSESEALAIVERQAAAGEAWAQFDLAGYKLAGRGLARDAHGAVGLLEKAAAQGSQQAALRLVTLYATGTGCAEQPERARTVVDICRTTDDFAAAQAHVLATDPEPVEHRCEALCDAPVIRLFRDVVSPLERRWITTLARPELEPSFVEEPGTGRRVPHPVRTSSGMSFGPLDEDLVVNRLNRRIAKISETGYSSGEPLHVLNYAPGEQYRPHFDALPGAANQRVFTAILYLNDEYEGGKTAFPELDLQVRGRAGDMLLFANVDRQGRRDPRSFHAGLPVNAGEKWIATRWIRQRRYHPWDK